MTESTLKRLLLVSSRKNKWNILICFATQKSYQNSIFFACGIFLLPLRPSEKCLCTPSQHKKLHKFLPDFARAQNFTMEIFINYLQMGKCCGDSSWDDLMNGPRRFLQINMKYMWLLSNKQVLGGWVALGDLFGFFILDLRRI